MLHSFAYGALLLCWLRILVLRVNLGVEQPVWKRIFLGVTTLWHSERKIMINAEIYFFLAV
jgi:hypothetical protein